MHFPLGRPFKWYLYFQQNPPSAHSLSYRLPEARIAAALNSQFSMAPSKVAMVLWCDNLLHQVVCELPISVGGADAEKRRAREMAEEPRGSELETRAIREAPGRLHRALGEVQATVSDPSPTGIANVPSWVPKKRRRSYRALRQPRSSCSRVTVSSMTDRITRTVNEPY